MNVKMSEEIVERDKDGKIVNHRINKTISWGSEPSFIKLYLQDLLYLSDVPSGLERILYALLKRMSYAGDENGMEIIVNASLKRRICEELGIKNIGSVSNAITNLVKGEILIRKDVGIYQFNPYLFGRGDWQDICRLRVEIDYSAISGKNKDDTPRTFKTVCEYKDAESKKTEKQKFEDVEDVMLEMDDAVAV